MGFHFVVFVVGDLGLGYAFGLALWGGIGNGGQCQTESVVYQPQVTNNKKNEVNGRNRARIQKQTLDRPQLGMKQDEINDHIYVYLLSFAL